MKQIANIWQHPRTSTAGMLIALASVAGILSQHGISIGKVGNGSVVTLTAALATALLGLVARDPGAMATAPATDPSTK